MQIQDYNQYFGLSYNEFVIKNNVDSNQIDENVRYEKLMNVTLINLRDQFFYFKDGKLRMIYISDATLAQKLWSEFKSLLNNAAPEKTVRSRAGKTANQLIFAKQGVTASITKDDVHFIEVYPPCSLEYYLEHIYREPGPFIR